MSWYQKYLPSPEAVNQLGQTPAASGEYPAAVPLNTTPYALREVQNLGVPPPSFGAAPLYGALPQISSPRPLQISSPQPLQISSAPRAPGFDVWSAATGRAPERPDQTTISAAPEAAFAPAPIQKRTLPAPQEPHPTYSEVVPNCTFRITIMLENIATTRLYDTVYIVNNRVVMGAEHMPQIIANFELYGSGIGVQDYEKIARISAGVVQLEFSHIILDAAQAFYEYAREAQRDHRPESLWLAGFAKLMRNHDESHLISFPVRDNQAILGYHAKLAKSLSHRPLYE